MSDDKDAIIEALRAENRRLNEEHAVRHDENAARMNAALMRTAQHAGGESSLAAIQNQGSSTYQPGALQADGVAMDASRALLQDWGLA